MPVQSLIDNALNKEQEARKDRVSSGKISPSGLGRCFRYQCLLRKGVPQAYDERKLRVFKAGHLFEKFVTDLIPEKQTQVLCETEDIRGYADIITKDTVIDIKSQHSFGFHYSQKEGYDVYKEKLGNWLQVCCYAKILSLPKISLVFLSKDDLCVAEYWCPTEKFLPILDEELKQLREVWAKKELPPIMPRCFIDKKTKKPKECTYCGFYETHCKENK